jgi:hypothetical protein
MKAVDSSQNIRYLPARHASTAAEAFAPAILAGVWSALFLLNWVLCFTEGAVPYRMIGLILLPLVWILFWVVILKLMILASVVVIKGLRRPEAECRTIVSGLFLMIGTVGACRLIQSSEPTTHALGISWLIGLPLLMVLRAVNSSKRRSR